jgi:hypothetical protein
MNNQKGADARAEQQKGKGITLKDVETWIGIIIGVGELFKLFFGLWNV